VMRAATDAPRRAAPRTIAPWHWLRGGKLGHGRERRVANLAAIVR
jgi:hypothetical protein